MGMGSTARRTPFKFNLLQPSISLSLSKKKLFLQQKCVQILRKNVKSLLSLTINRFKCLQTIKKPLLFSSFFFVELPKNTAPNLNPLENTLECQLLFTLTNVCIIFVQVRLYAAATISVFKRNFLSDLH